MKKKSRQPWESKYFSCLLIVLWERVKQRQNDEFIILHVYIKTKLFLIGENLILDVLVDHKVFTVNVYILRVT